MNNNEKSQGKTFNRALFALVVPIALQNLISAVVNSADVFMLGSVDQASMSAVSLAGQLSFILMLFCMGLSLGAGVLTAQYWGKKDLPVIERVMNLAVIFMVSISVIFFLFSQFMPETLIRIFTKDAELIQYGAAYQRALSWSYLPMGLSQIYLSVAKSMENVRLTAIVSSVCLIINVLLNAFCIFVLFPGNSEKAVIGVAFSTVTARVCELVICIIHSKIRGKVQFRCPKFDAIGIQLLKDFVKYSLPVIANYVVWGGAITATAAIIGHVSADMVAANSIASVVKNLAVILCGGISGGGAVLIGKYLGTGDKELAKKAGIRIYIYALIFGVIAGITVLALRPILFHIVNLNDTAQNYLNGMLLICAYYCIGKSLNSTVIGGIFNAGGDAKFSFICDTVVMWGIIIPIGFLCAFVWKLEPIMLYAVLCLDEFVKLPAAIIRFRQYKWLNNITREFKGSPAEAG
jgi:putative efflux protein, MATE family